MLGVQKGVNPQMFPVNQKNKKSMSYKGVRGNK